MTRDRFPDNRPPPCAALASLARFLSTGGDHLGDVTEQRCCTSAADTLDRAAAAPDRVVRGAAGDRSRARVWAARHTTADGRACRSSRRPTTQRPPPAAPPNSKPCAAWTTAAHCGCAACVSARAHAVPPPLPPPLPLPPLPPLFFRERRLLHHHHRLLPRADIIIRKV